MPLREPLFDSGAGFIQMPGEKMIGARNDDELLWFRQRAEHGFYLFL